MKNWLVFILACVIVILSSNQVYGEKSTFFDSVKFIQYLDESTALEEVRNGNIDLYYYRISSDRLESQQDREGLQVFDSIGGTYSVLVNPAESEEFNPFSNQEIRFALNYLIDRKLIVNELMGGYGSPIVSYYSPTDPEYLTVIEQLENFNFKYNPTLAKKIINEALEQKGATKINEKWHIESKPIEITIFIRSDDPVRKSMGEILADELEKVGFIVKKDFGDLNKAFVSVYGSNPADLKWNLYTEGWGQSVFKKYDSIGLGQMYSPWFSNMPGFNDPSYWNYKNEKLDELTQKIYTGDFNSVEERESLIQQAVVEGVNESVRIFVASKIDQYIASENIDGIINDFGAGVPTRFTPINANGEKNELTIGVKQIYQGAWNPVMGLTDTYSRQIWWIVSDPGTFKHPYTGETFPVRVNWDVETRGPYEKLKVSKEAKLWNPENQEWEKVPGNTLATSKVTFDFKFSNWHNKEMMDMNDIVHSLYFTIEWGTQTNQNDKTFDTEYTPQAAQGIQTIKGINVIDEDTVEVYVDYWHFDHGEIAEWAALWNSMPWEIISAMEEAVKDGKTSFSRSGSTSKNVSWLSLIVPNDSQLIKEYLLKFRNDKYVPSPLKGKNQDYYQNRYEASINWIEKYNHAIISNGPFYLEYYAPESRTISVKAFEDKSYPFKKGHWSEFEDIEYPTITEIDMDKTIQKGEKTTITIKTKDSDEIRYFLINNFGKLVLSESIGIDDNKIEIELTSNETRKLGTGANSIKIFAISDNVLRPDFYESGFIVTDKKMDLPTTELSDIGFKDNNSEYNGVIGIVLITIAITAIATFAVYRKKRK